MAGARPSTFKKSGGGFLNEVDGLITDYQFTDEFPGGSGSPRKGKSDFRPLYAVLSARVDGADEDVTTTMFVGSADDFEITNEGHTLTPVDDSVGLRQNAEWCIFINSLVESGFPEELLPEDEISFEAIVGTRVRFVQRVNDEKTQRLGKRKGKDGKKEYARTDLVIAKVYALPGNDSKPMGAGKKASAPAKKATTAKAGPAKAAPAGEDLDDLAVATLTDILMENGEPLIKSKLGVRILKKLNKHPLRDKVYKQLFDDDFLGQENGWTYDASTQMLSV